MAKTDFKHIQLFISSVFLNFRLWVKDLDTLGCKNGFYTSRSPWGQLHMPGNLKFDPNKTKQKTKQKKKMLFRSTPDPF